MGRAEPGGGTTVKFGIESQGANLGSVLLWTGDWSVRQWHQFAIHVHWSTNSQNGVVDVWFDGQPVITGHKHNTKFDNNAMFFNVGLHRVLPQNFVETIYFDDFIEADTQSEIKIAAPLTGGSSDGGTGDAATNADASTSGAAGASAGGAAGGDVESGTAGNGVTGSGGGLGSATGGNAGAGGAPTTGHAAPPDASGCTCVVSETSSPPKRWDAVACFVAALALSHRRRRARR